MKADSILLRQVHPNFFPGGQLSSQAFFPFPKDKGKLSVYDGLLISPAQSFEHYTRKQGLESVGVWGINDAEVIRVFMAYTSQTGQPRAPWLGPRSIELYPKK